MSRHSSQERSVTIGDAEFLAVIREEQRSPAISSVNINDVNKKPCSKSGSTTKCCLCKSEKKDPNNADILKILAETEAQLREEYNEKFEQQMELQRDRFNYILQNEQVRATMMLREAHRERQEKIAALQNQLECKNLAGLMFVLASERRKSRLERMRIVEEYTNHISMLQSLLGEGQGLILDLSKGYKTAARIDQEWREKMKKVVREFQNFVHSYMGGYEACTQYFFDLPALLKTEASIHNDPTEDPCDEEESKEEEEIPLTTEDQDHGTWWQRLENECRPFVVFGDMSDFKPPQRRAVLKVVKGAKCAPRRWKEYVFNDMFLQSDCKNLDSIKHELPHRMSPPGPWESHEVLKEQVQSESSRRAPSIDTKYNMGSILKLITATQSGIATHQDNKATLLAARDSMEIASSCKILREKRSSRVKNGNDVLDIRKRTASIFQDDDEDDEDYKPTKIPPPSSPPKEIELQLDLKEEEEANDGQDFSRLGSIHNDSLEVIHNHNHVPDVDANIHPEKVCPMEKCKRMQMDSFVGTLPPYMKANPFTHFEQTFDGYETCSPEQLQILRERIEKKNNKEKRKNTESDPLAEWKVQEEESGVAVQTSVDSLMFPPCACTAPSPTPASSVSNGQVYKIEDLIPVKQFLDHINETCLHDSNIQFDRFKVVGQKKQEETKSQGDCAKSKYQEIKRILEQHPSLCDIFQGSPQC